MHKKGGEKMAVWTYEDIIPSLIENTVMRKGFSDGEHVIYTIQAVEGYVLHNTALDSYAPDYETGGSTLVLGYTTAEISCNAHYAFTPTQVTAVNGQTVTAYGSREIYAIPSTEVPTDQIFGGGDNNHEIM